MRILILLTIFIAANVSAKESNYTIALPNSEFYPQYTEGKNQEAQGLLPIILKKFSDDEKISMRFIFLPIKRYMEYLKRGEVDFILPDNKSWGLDYKKNLNLFYSDEIMQSHSGVIVTKQNKDIKLNDLKTLGTISGYSVHEFEPQEKSKQLKISFNNNPKNLLRQVATGRIQGAYLHVDVALYMAKTLNLELVEAKSLPSSVYSYHLSTIKHESIIKNFN